MSYWIIAIVIGWIVSGFVSAGFMVPFLGAGRDSGMSYRTTLGLATVFGIFGPVALLLVFCASGFGEKGWSFRRAGRGQSGD